MLTKSDWMNGLRWCRDEAGAFIASFWMILLLYAIGFGLLFVFFEVDAQFSRPLAGGVIPPEVTQHGAWAVRVFSVIAFMGMMWCQSRGLPKTATRLRVLGVTAGALLLLHAFGLSAKIMEGQYIRAAAETDNSVTVTQTVESQIEAIDAQIEGIERRTDRRVANLQSSIDSITNDGLNNDDLADIYRADQTKAQDEADAAIAALEARKLELIENRGQAVSAATTTAASVVSFNELFTFMARVVTFTWNPDEEPSEMAQFVSGFVFFFLFWGFLELLMMNSFPNAYAMQLRAAENARRSRAAKQGHETRKEKAEAESRDQRRSGKRLEAANYYAERLPEIIEKVRNNPRYTLAGIRDTWFKPLSISELTTVLNTLHEHGRLTLEDRDMLLRRGEWLPADPRAPINGKGDKDADDDGSRRADQGV